MKIDELIKNEPYSKKVTEKNQIFLESMKQVIQFHYENCKEYKNFCIKKKFDPYGIYSLEAIPFLPISIFKKLELLSVPKKEIVRTIHSSSTTNTLPSVINLDSVTVKRQIIALNSIIKNYFGNDKQSFLIIDQDAVIQTNNLELSSRGSAIRGMLGFSKDFHFLLNEKLVIDRNKIIEALTKIDKKKTCVFGFTWLIYRSMKDNKDIKKLFNSLENPYILHIGGWKKLSDVSIDKNDYNKMVSEFFNTKPENVIDFYGMTEQLGIVYPDCSAGYKHIPIFAEILIRDIHEQKCLTAKKTGFIQILSPIPNSYPGISILTDDIGEIIGEDDCPCGRKGKYFRFTKRSEMADPKGCGDTLAM